MEKKSDRRIRRTKALLRHGLAQLMSCLLYTSLFLVHNIQYYHICMEDIDTDNSL